MLICKGVGVILLATLVVGSPHRETRGLLEEASKLFEGLHSGLGNIEAAARHEVSKLKPWADRVEEEMGPAMKRVEEQLGSAIETLSERLGNAPLFNSHDRLDTHLTTTDEMPGLHSLFSDTFNHGQPLDPFAIFGMRRKQWYEGPNVCVDRRVALDGDEANPEDYGDHNEEEEEDTNRDSRAAFFAMDMSFTSCQDDHNLHECTTHVTRDGVKKSVTVRHECCYGYERSINGEGCSKMAMDTLSKTIDSMGVTEFAELLKSSDIRDMLEENVTIFVPSDDAVEDFRHDLQQLNNLDSDQMTYNVDPGLVERKRRDVDLTIAETPSLSEILKGHIVDGFVDTADIHDEDLLMSKNGNNLRMTVYNTYPQRAVMANCAKVTSRDHYSTNGVIHVIDKVIMPATKTLGDIISTDMQFRSLKEVLTSANLMDKLNQPGQMTLFAPSDAAFERLDQATKDKISRGNGCSKDILLNHILPNVICTGVIESKAKTLNSLDKHVILARDEETDSMSIEGVKIIMKDIMGTNGVIHVVDEVLIPEAARSVPEALEDNHRTILKELFDIAGINDALSNMTIFAPSEKALGDLPESMLEDMKSNPEKLKEFLLYHVGKPKTCQCEMTNNKLMPTGVEGKHLRINTYNNGVIPFMDRKSAKYTVQCARVTHMDSEVCGGMIHSVDKVLLPPVGNVIDIIKHDSKHTTFMELVELAEMKDELNDAEGPYTILAPTNGAFDNMNDELRKEIFADKEIASKVVRHHVLNEMVCCAGISRSFMFFDQSTKFTLLEDDVVSVRRSNGGYLYADRAEVTTCDMVADNGVVHAIDRVLLPIGIGPERQERSQQRRRFVNFDPMELFRRSRY